MTEQTQGDVILRLSNIETFYGPIMAIRGVSLEVPRGAIVTRRGWKGKNLRRLIVTRA